MIPQQSDVTQLLEVARQPSASLRWGTKRGKLRSPRYTPASIWYTTKQLAERTSLSERTIEDFIENNRHFVRAANLETVDHQPVYALRELYQKRLSLVGHVTAILANRNVG